MTTPQTCMVPDMLAVLFRRHAEETALSPFPETARFQLNSADELMMAGFMCHLFGSEVSTDKAHVLVMLALAITILEEDDGYF
jgi:hypothetical protein